MRSTIAALVFLPLSAVTLAADTFSADVWADNWFEMRIDGVQVAEDSVHITTERSFNAESFMFDAERPFVIGLVAKDFKENDTGLEYIGTGRQQMGDGGVILQIFDAAGVPVVTSGSAWQCLVIHSAPLDKSCERNPDPVAGEGPCTFMDLDEPVGWDQAGFDASAWPSATVFSAHAVDPKDGYDRVAWVEGAEFMWGPDLEQSNTVLCRLSVE
ncbi:PEBP family protein [uncultured Tateyamaria sp.]|uniref:PEBP family protein n=1 Tax=uncultured Tateyamaria sp. TaxID=455651 RepID=UPI00260B402C|nr:PEBP family protein [uncultured Tateyamaria sp.]